MESGGEIFEARPGSLFTFEPDERRSVSSDEGARLLLFLAPWPGPGHYRGEEQSRRESRLAALQRRPGGGAWPLRRRYARYMARSIRYMNGMKNPV